MPAVAIPSHKAGPVVGSLKGLKTVAMILGLHTQVRSPIAGLPAGAPLVLQRRTNGMMIHSQREGQMPSDASEQSWTRGEGVFILLILVTQILHDGKARIFSVCDPVLPRRRTQE